MNKYKIALISLVVGFIHNSWGANETDMLNNSTVAEENTKKEDVLLIDSSSPNEALNDVIAQACADLRGNGDF